MDGVKLIYETRRKVVKAFEDVKKNRVYVVLNEKDTFGASETYLISFSADDLYWLAMRKMGEAF